VTAYGKYQKLTKTTESNRKLTENYQNQPKSTENLLDGDPAPLLQRGTCLLWPQLDG